MANPPLSPSGGERRRPGAGRLLGFDRSGPPPPQTTAGSPLRPFTVPNAIGFARLALIPLFLVLSLTSDSGPGALEIAIFALAGFGDYADGLAARATGQYSRLGTLMDPVTDRLLVVSGVVVCWRFDLLPHWALAVLAARELAMLGLARYGLHRGVDVRINWPGRLAIPPVMGSLFFGMLEVQPLANVLLYIGVAMTLLATALYVRQGLRVTRHRALGADGP